MSEETELAEDAATETMDAETAARVSAENMRLLENIDVALTVEVGKAEIKIRDLAPERRVGDRARPPGGRPAGHSGQRHDDRQGRVVMVGERFGAAEIVDPAARMESV